MHAVGCVLELSHALAARKTQAAPVDVARDLLDAGHRARGQPAQQRVSGERRAKRQAQLEVLVHDLTVARRLTTAR